MELLLRTIDKTADGREIVREKPLSGTRIGIGRAAENAIHIPDLAVEQHHAVITEAPEGRLKVEAAGGLGFGLDGRQTRSATINPRESHELTFGASRLAIAEEDGRIVITMREAEDAREVIHDAVAGFSLGYALPSKRLLAWAAVTTILLLFLVVPIGTHLMRAPAAPKIDTPGQVMLDASWETGRLSLAHHGLENNCEACHVQAFVAVRDQTCVSCHKDINDHAPSDRLAAGRGADTWGDALLWQVAHAFNKPGPGACTDCHTEHEGAGRMAPTQQQFCADCHGSLGDRLTDTKLADASDFGRVHPQFQAAVFTNQTQTAPQRISLAERPREWKGIRFPHDLHLDRNGGVARMAANIGSKKNYGSALECKDCHRPTADGVRFLPVDMERDCETCHSLVYDKVGGTFRTLRHGDVDQMQADLAAMDRSPRRAVVTGRGRPGAFAPGGLYYQNFGTPDRSYVGINRAMARDGVCGECHFPTTSGGRLGVLPVNQPSRYFAHGRFDHADHRQENCTSCHKADTSKESADLLLPGIAQCRTCHLGENTRTAEVPSGCAMCHSYHSRDIVVEVPPRIALNGGRE
jgi:predicted CXXCH cytochrome family protein